MYLEVKTIKWMIGEMSNKMCGVFVFQSPHLNGRENLAVIRAFTGADAANTL